MDKISEIPLYEIDESCNIIISFGGDNSLQYSLPSSISSNTVVELRNFLGKVASSFTMEWSCYCSDWPREENRLILTDQFYLESCGEGHYTLTINDSLYDALQHYLSIVDIEPTRKF